MKKLIITILFLSISLFAQGDKPEADCLILEDENSIICKYIHGRSSSDKNVIFEWIDPDGKISRTREMLVPANHGSVYDFRYMDGRKKGIWTFQIKDGEDILKTQFEIK